MTKLATVAGLEMFCNQHLQTDNPVIFSMAEADTKGNYEILLGGKLNGSKRRFAYCTHKNDAECILEALQIAVKNGVI